MSRPRVRPTARLAGMLAAAGLVYVFATNSEVVWLYLVAGLILALLPVGLAGPPLGLRRLRLEVGERRREGFEPPLRQDRGGVFAGDRVSIRLRAARGSLLGCQAGAIRFGLDRADGPEAPGTGWGVGLEVDPSGRSAWLHLQPPRRGLYRIAALDLRSGWPLSLLQATRRVALEADLLVLPRYWLPPGERPADRTEGGEAARRRGLGEDFVGLREYQPSDPQRRIHWPTSARTGALMVVATAAPSLDPAAYEVAIDASAGPGARDLAAGVAASLISGSVAAGRPFRAGLGGGVARGWREALRALATLEAGTPPRSALAAAATAITADAAGVLVRVGEVETRLAAETTLEEARLALAGTTATPRRPAAVPAEPTATAT